MDKKRDKLQYPKTKKIKVVDNYHGTKVEDNYQWFEDYSNIKVQEWIKEQEKLTYSFLKKFKQIPLIEKRLNDLWRYDVRSIPLECLKGKRIFFSEKKKDDEKSRFYTKKTKNSKEVILLDPNKWDESESLSYIRPSVDGKYIAFGKSKRGDENPILYVMEVESKKILKDKVTGWRQVAISWMRDNSGFFYSRYPLKREVGDGEEFYWQAIYFHKLGDPPSKDKKIFYHENIKELMHSGGLTEDGKYIIFSRGTWGKDEHYFKKIGDTKLTPIVTGMDAGYSVNIIKDKIIIWTDKDAPNWKVYITDVNKPEREHWKEFIPESEDKLLGLSAIAGHLFVTYLHKAHTIIKVYSLEGKYIKKIKLPGIGLAGVGGLFSKPTIWLSYSSFLSPSATYKYNLKTDKLKLFFRPPLKIDFSKYTTEQIEYESKDKTKITMFLIHRKDLKRDSGNPILLTGYGGFNIPETPSFSSMDIIWLEAGGMIAIPNLRGGGEYGKKWWEAGRLQNKQNVFDDFISVAEWLIDNNYTNPRKLAISGGSNGGLLVGAAMTQHPDLFRVVGCHVPLLDMLRYHHLSIAKIWIEEYGCSEDPTQFEYLYKYSPYHNVKKDMKYPATLITTSENDLRVDPMHALKMTAKLQEFDFNGEPHFLLVRKGSGHGGGTTMSIVIRQSAEDMAFLMEILGMKYKQLKKK